MSAPGNPPSRRQEIVFRVDASLHIGTGHAARCLCLADAFAERGARVRFLTRSFDPAVPGWLRERGYETVGLPAPPRSGKDSEKDSGKDRENDQESWLGVPWERDAEEVRLALRDAAPDLLIVDHYGLDHRWESGIRPRVRKLMVLEDGGDRLHDCDLLLDQNLHGRKAPDASARVPGHCRLLLGPRYALLRPEFRMPEAELPEREGRLRKILIFFGGSDPENEAGKALAGLKDAVDPEMGITVVAGVLNPHLAALERMREHWPGLVIHRQIDFMARLMKESDLAIGAGGTATWERCRMGLPALVAILAENQAEIAAAVADQGAQRTLGWHGDLQPEDYANAFRGLDKEALAAMSKAGRRLVDGKGCARVVEAVGEP